ncbi:MAG: hypothetical protein HYZ53_02380 [Planctomycetes bacterium]|nr:hypothetical protein [Planctomycetota bacterium]
MPHATPPARLLALALPLAFVLAAHAPSATAQSSRELEEKVQRLEKEVEELKSLVRERKASEEGELKARVDRYLAEARPAGGVLQAARDRVKLGGYATLLYHNLGDLSGDAPLDKHFDVFSLKRVVLSVSADVTERLKVGAEIEFEQEVLESFLEKRRGIDVDEIELERLHIDWHFSDALNLRLGQVLVPFGKYNQIHDDNLHELPDRPLVDTFVIPTAWGETGVSLFGSFAFSEESFLTYDLAVVNGLNEGLQEQNPFEEHHGLNKARGDIGADNNGDKAVVGRVGVHPLGNLELGVSGYTGVYRDRGNERVNGVALDYRWDFLSQFTLQGEAAYFDVEKPSDRFLAQLFAEREAAGELAAGFPGHTWGLYSELVYRFFPEFLKDTFLAKGLDAPTLEAVVRYDYAMVDDVVPLADGSFEDVRAGRLEDADQYRLTLGLGYRPSPAVIFSFGYMWNAGDMQYFDGDGVFLGASVGF